jgi:hypothetical protein
MQTKHVETNAFEPGTKKSSTFSTGIIPSEEKVLIQIQAWRFFQLQTLARTT